MRRARVATALLSGALLASACGRRGAEPPHERTVAEIDGRKVSLADLEAYLADNLVGATSEEPAEPEELDRVKSRLLDGLLDEVLLAAEAERRGIRATDEEVEAFESGGGPADDDEPPPSEKDRETARRELLVQKVREADASEHAKVSSEEVDEYARTNADELRGKQRVRMQSLGFTDPEQAARVRRDITAGRVTFAEAALRMHGGRKEESQIAVPLGGLPEPVRAAVAGLSPGRVSEPVRLDGTTFLFLVEAGPEVAPSGPDVLRELARDELIERRYREASKTLVARLRSGARIVVHEDVLPFHYVPDTPS